MQVLNFYIPTSIFVLINLIVLYVLLKFILFKPVTNLMDKRTKSIKEALESADKAKAEAADLKSKFNGQISAAKEEADKILEEARIRANKEYEAIIAGAKQDAENVLARAREEIDRERAQMIRDIKGQVTGLALAAASKVMEANMDTESNRALVDKFIDEVGAA